MSAERLADFCGYAYAMWIGYQWATRGPLFAIAAALVVVVALGAPHGRSGGSVSAATVVAYDPLRDSRHRTARAAREQQDWLAWLELGGLAARTLEEYERNTAVLLRLFPDTPFEEFSDGDLAHALRTFPNAGNRVAAYRNWFKWGRRTGRRPDNPCDLLPEFRRKKRKVLDIFTDAEEAALCALPTPDGQLMTVLFDAGLRRQEAVCLTVRRCDLQRRRVIVKEGAKGARERVVPMGDRLAQALGDLFLFEGLGPKDHLWYSRPGGGRRVRRDRPASVSSFRDWWIRCLDAADVAYKRPHMTRHTFATRWRARGLDLDEIQVLLGHASIQTTRDIYVHTEVDDIARRMEELLA